MKASTHHVGYGQIEYNENFWTGKRELTVNGEKLTKKKRNVFTLSSENGDLDCRIKGSFLTGATLYIDQDVIQLSEPCKWYEFLCSALIFVFVLVWGNVPQLCMIMPIVGGAIGGAISGLSACINLFLMKHVKPVGYKLFMWFGIFLLTIWQCSMVANFILLSLY